MEKREKMKMEKKSKPLDLITSNITYIYRKYYCTGRDVTRF